MVGGDRVILEGYLAWQRRTLLNICAGLTGEQLARRPIPSSNLSLLGLLRHMAKVERVWFRIRIGREPIEWLYAGSPDKDADFNELDPAKAEAAVERLGEECRLADLVAAAADVDDTIDARGEVMSVRMVYVHMIGEYARHNGHADLLRESIDSVTNR